MTTVEQFSKAKANIQAGQQAGRGPLGGAAAGEQKFDAAGEEQAAAAVPVLFNIQLA